MPELLYLSKCYNLSGCEHGRSKQLRTGLGLRTDLYLAVLLFCVLTSVLRSLNDNKIRGSAMERIQRKETEGLLYL